MQKLPMLVQSQYVLLILREPTSLWTQSMLMPKPGRGRRTQLPLPRRSRNWQSTAAHQVELRHRIRRHMGVEHPTPRRSQRRQTPPLRPKKVLHLERSRRQHLEDNLRRREHRQRHRRPRRPTHRRPRGPQTSHRARNISQQRLRDEQRRRPARPLLRHK
jgi:hypothetical protein